MLCSYFSFAQVSVSATAGTTGPTAYTTLGAAFNAINAGTHQGAITVTISASFTETAKDSLVGSGTGTASYTSVLVKPASGTSPEITGVSATALFILNGANNVTVDGSNTTGGTTKNLTITNTDAAGNTVRFINGASNNVFKNCIIKGSPAGSAVVLMFTSTGATGNNNNTFDNNDITKSTGNPAAGIFNVGSSTAVNTGNTYKNNKISDFTLYGFIDGTGAATPTSGFSTNTLFEGNEIFHTGTVTSTATGITGIFLGNAGSVTNMTISKNKIYNIQPGGTTYTAITGIDLYDATSVNLYNNMVSLSSATLNIRGIAQETGSPAAIKVYYNTVNIYGAATAGSSFAFLKNYTSTGDDFKNNIFSNTRISTGTAKQYAISKSSTGTFTSNYNDFYVATNANSTLASFGTTTTTDYATLATFQAASGTDANSISVMPVFVSNTDLHLDPANNSGIDNKGTPVTGVTVDFDNQARSTTTPDIGVDEFSSTSTCTAPAITTQPTAQAVCAGSAINLSVVATGTSLTYQWRKGGTNISGATSATYTIASAAAGDAGNYDVVITNTCGTVTSAAVAVTINAATVITTQPTSVTACQGNATFTVAATGTGTLTYQWKLNGVNVTTGTGGTTNSFSVPVVAANAGSYTVTVSGTCGSVTSNAATLTVQNCTSVPNVDADVTSIIMMPNIVRDMTTLRVIALRTMKMNINVVDAQGKVVLTLNKQVLTGQNDISIYLGQLANGTYQLQGATDKGSVGVVRFVKM